MALKDKGGFLVDNSQWEKMKKNLMKGQHLAAKVGFFDSYYGPENDNLSVAQVAQWQEEGTRGGQGNGSGIPMRPFMRYYIMKLETDEKLVRELAPFIHQIAIGTMTWTQLYSKLGIELVADLKQVIEKWSIPMNSPSTVKQKGFNDPLIDTKKMMDSVEYQLGRKSLGG